MALMVDPTHLVTVSSIAERVNVPRTNVNAWTRSKSFPEPLETPGLSGRIYFWPDVAAYVAARPHLGIDLSSSASRQHYIDTGVYLHVGDGLVECDAKLDGCEGTYDEGTGDGYCGTCPSCADKQS